MAVRGSFSRRQFGHVVGRAVGFFCVASRMRASTHSRTSSSELSRRPNRCRCSAPTSVAEAWNVVAPELLVHRRVELRW